MESGENQVIVFQYHMRQLVLWIQMNNGGKSVSFSFYSSSYFISCLCEVRENCYCVILDWVCTVYYQLIHVLLFSLLDFIYIVSYGVFSNSIYIALLASI